MQCISYLSIVTSPTAQDLFGREKDLHDAWVGLNKEFDIIPHLTYETWYDISINRIGVLEIELDYETYHDLILKTSLKYPKIHRIAILLNNMDIINQITFIVYNYIQELLSLIYRLENLISYVPPVDKVTYDLNTGLIAIVYNT